MRFARSTFGAGGKTRLQSSVQKKNINTPCLMYDCFAQALLDATKLPSVGGGAASRAQGVQHCLAYVDRVMTASPEQMGSVRTQ